MNVKLTLVEQTDQSVLRQLMQLYLYDFSQYDDADVNRHGLYEYQYLDNYWTEPNRHPYFITVDDMLAGFVLVNNHTMVLEDDKAMSISEFFVMRKYRRTGVGNTAAVKIFNTFPGRWEVSQVGSNKPSKIFWEKVIRDYIDTNHEIQTVQVEGAEVQVITFDNSKTS